MGLFSSKKKKKFYTAVQRMIEDDAIVLSSKSAVINYLFTEKGSTSLNSKSLPDYLIEAAQNNMPSKYKRGYRFAANGHYTGFGLPTAATSRLAIDIPAKVKEIMELELGTTVDMLYAHLEEANTYHFMWKILMESHGYNPTTNELETLSLAKGFTCYLTRAQIHFCQATADAVIDSSYFDQWGLSTESGATVERVQDLNALHVNYVIDPGAVEDFCLVEYEYLEIIPDTTAPTAFQTNSYDGFILEGVCEKGATVEVYDTAATPALLGTGTADTLGHLI